jgi:uncharacterized membrane protein YdjX (TVP38/TMEM64 family)
MNPARETASSASGAGSMLKLFGVFLLLALVMFLPFLFWGDRVEAALDHDRLVALFNSYRSVAWLLAIVLLASDLLLPIPNTIVMAALGALYGPMVGGVVATLGNCLSGMLGFGLCRQFGRPLAVRLMSPAEIAQGEKLFALAGGWIVAGSRWAPVVSEVISCMAGLSNMRSSTFLLALVCGAAPLGFTVAAVGYALSDRPVLIIALCALLPLPIWFVVRAASAVMGRKQLSVAGDTIGDDAR